MTCAYWQAACLLLLLLDAVVVSVAIDLRRKREKE